MQVWSAPLLLYLEREEFTVSAVDFETFAIVPRRVNDEHLDVQNAGYAVNPAQLRELQLT